MRTTPVALFLAGLLAVSMPALSAAPRALWVWEGDTESLVLDPAAADQAIALARREGVRTFYLYADSFQDHNLISDQPQKWQQLLRRLHAAGISVHALLGSAYLHTEGYVLPENRKQALAMVERVLLFNARTASVDARFDAIHFDIEPHQLPQWDSDRDGLLREFLDLGQAYMDLKRKLGSDIPVGPDIPFWLDGISLSWQGQTRSVAEHAIRLFDFVTLMDYRNRAEGSDGIIAHAQDEMDLAKRLGRRVIIGVETGDGELPKVTFQGRTHAEMEQELASTEAAFRDNPAFAGFAIHHYATWQAWLKRNGR